jgi:hypothetical protein
MMILLSILLYLVVGFVLASLMAKYTEAFDTGSGFVLVFFLYPIFLIAHTIIYISLCFDDYTYWLKNKQKIDNTFHFLKKVYI